jgi:hypothetical protein
MPSRLDDASEKITWREGKQTLVKGGRASVEQEGGDIFLALSLRNVGSGIAVLQSWRVSVLARPAPTALEAPEVGLFRRQGRDLYVPAGGVSFWQGRIESANDEYLAVRDAIGAQGSLIVYLLYSDHEGGQRAITLFMLDPASDSQWLCSVIRHWNLDRPDPR